jgi:hypothetical protein
MVEKRTRQRFPLQLPIVVAAGGEELEVSGITRDVSSAGVFFYMKSWPSDKSTLEFRMIMPPELTGSAGARAVCKGKVVRVEAGSEFGVTGVAATIDTYRLGSQLNGV